MTVMMKSSLVLFVSGILMGSALKMPELARNIGLSVPKSPPLSSPVHVSRREWFVGAASAGFLLTHGAAPAAASAVGDDELVDVYFGCGCFWHVQHEFIVAEKKLLGRSNEQLTSLSGYAGGTAKDSKVCYHNMKGVQDYGKLGHAEVVGMRIPASKFGAVAEEYFKLFDNNGVRPDQFGDRGSEYRNLVGFPGGATNKAKYTELLEASLRTGDRVDFGKGKGNDADAKALVWVMDSIEYPFHVAEPYHQFHDGFRLDENYPDDYNGLAGKLLSSGSFRDSGCPNGLIGIGVGGL